MRIAPRGTVGTAGVGLAALVGTALFPLVTALDGAAAYSPPDHTSCSGAADAGTPPIRYDAAPLAVETPAVSAALPVPRLGAPAGMAGVVGSPARATAVPVRVFVHILRTDHGGGVGDDRVHRQIRILNQAYAGKQSAASAVSPFVFRVARIDRTTNQRWFRMDEGTVAEGHAKRALHRGDAGDLNLYIGMNRSASLGWATPPGSYDRLPKMDGVVIRRTTMAGGKGGHYSWGDVAVHETGHWLGLLHTFNGRCGTRGDLVADTPREARPSYTCPIRRNTCSAPGRDPVHNFMDYSVDACMNMLTAGQVRRIDTAFEKWRL